jgi:hypothetical protein
MFRAHFTLPSLYLAQEIIVDRLNIPFLVIRLLALGSQVSNSYIGECSVMDQPHRNHALEAILPLGRRGSRAPLLPAMAI